MTILVVAVVVTLLKNVPMIAADEYDEYVRQVLEEERRQQGGHDNDWGQTDESYNANQQQQRQYQEEQRQYQEEQRKLEEDRQRERQESKQEQIRAERESAFERDLERMNEEQRKLALKRKRKDAKVVQNILRDKDNLYAVLGLRNWKITIGPFRPFGLFDIGPFELFHVDAKDIKRAYRARAISVHPDKNRDGRAQEAFVLVESAASLLSDEKERAEYDLQRRIMRQEQREKLEEIVQKFVATVQALIAKVVWVFRRILGPFATPIFILLCLLI